VVRFYVVVVIESDVRLEGYCIGRGIGWSSYEHANCHVDRVGYR
jgi:hypothetical protein